MPEKTLHYNIPVYKELITVTPFDPLPITSEHIYQTTIVELKKYGYSSDPYSPAVYYDEHTEWRHRYNRPIDMFFRAGYDFETNTLILVDNYQVTPYDSNSAGKPIN